MSIHATARRTHLPASQLMLFEPAPGEAGAGTAATGTHEPTRLSQAHLLPRPSGRARAVLEPTPAPDLLVMALGVSAPRPFSPPGTPFRKGAASPSLVPSRAPPSTTSSGQAPQSEPSDRLVRVLAEGLQRIAERRAREQTEYRNRVIIVPRTDGGTSDEPAPDP